MSLEELFCDVDDYVAGSEVPSVVKSREIIDQLFEAFGAFLLPVFECLNRYDVSQRLLRDLVIV